MRNFEYAILAQFNARLYDANTPSLREFKCRGWLLSKTNLSHTLSFNFEPNEERKKLAIELQQRQEKWSNQFSGKRSRNPSAEEKEEENLLQDEIRRKAHNLSEPFVYQEILANPEFLYVNFDILNLLNQAGADGWETTGKLPGSQRQGEFGITMMRRMLK